MYTVTLTVFVLLALGSAPTPASGQTRPSPPPPKPRPPRPPRPRPPPLLRRTAQRRPPPPRPKPPSPKPPPRPPPPRPKPPPPKPPSPRPPPRPPPPRPPPRPPPPSPPPDVQCRNRIPQCTACALNQQAGSYQCSACDAYSKLDTTGYFDTYAGTFHDEPYCDGLCMHYRTAGLRLEDNTLPCQSCSGTMGCGSCLAGSFKAPDTYSQYVYRLPATTPTTCATCGVCQFGKCGVSGCTACDPGATPLKVAGTAQLNDPQICITEYCDEVAPGKPQNSNLYSYYPSCAVVDGEPRCSPTTGCTACPAGHFRAKHPLVPTAARCVRCEGCPNNVCGASGCASCPIAGLGARVTMANITTAAGRIAYACRNAIRVAFRGRGVLPHNAVWPLSEFAGCGVGVEGGTGDFRVSWKSSERKGDSNEDPKNFELEVPSWLTVPDDPLSAILGPTNTTASISFQFQTASRTIINFTYRNRLTNQQVTKTVYHSFPKSQDQVCILFFNNVTSHTEDANMTAQISVVNTSGKKILLRMSGQRSFTPRTGAPDLVPPAGGITLFGRNGKLLGSPSSGVQWRDLATENLVLLPSEEEWDDLS